MKSKTAAGVVKFYRALSTGLLRVRLGTLLQEQRSPGRDGKLLAILAILDERGEG
jgi:hypothetical protein